MDVESLTLVLEGRAGERLISEGCTEACGCDDMRKGSAVVTL
jgi:hypothetical protein